MNAFKLSLLFIALIAVMNIQQPVPQVRLEKSELKNGETIQRSGELQIPTMLKWDAPLVKADKEGVIILRIKEMRFLYKRGFDATRNEYILTRAYISSIGVKKGDKIEIDFSQSNMENGSSVPVMIKVR